ncbi:DUF397 domain-containing protein [Kineosporia babensis]|uniref:DUF397 domain-containing protein n=1 Tax=Kineosporia babensis TaxID=499548 RepID=A0A9X1NKE6_9ACTN|nr:DUF397 domain-containing protein [Kineosporia babensis]
MSIENAGTGTDSGTWADFRKSTFSGGGGCVEVSLSDQGGARVRDTKSKGQGPVLEFNAEEWSAFLAGARAGEFGTPHS